MQQKALNQGFSSELPPLAGPPSSGPSSGVPPLICSSSQTVAARSPAWSGNGSDKEKEWYWAMWEAIMLNSGHEADCLAALHAL